jgi:hypothetical protein
MNRDALRLLDTAKILFASAALAIVSIGMALAGDESVGYAAARDAAAGDAAARDASVGYAAAGDAAAGDAGDGRLAAPTVHAPPVKGPATGLADSAALRATVFRTPPQDIAPMPASVPLVEIDVRMPWAQRVPNIFWFDKALRVWFSAQDKPAPLAIARGAMAIPPSCRRCAACSTAPVIMC